MRGNHDIAGSGRFTLSSMSTGQLSPVEFIPVLESYGLIGQVVRWVLEQSFTQCKRWSETHPSFIMVISLPAAARRRLRAVRGAARRAHRVDPASIVLEMTESYFVTDMDALRATFDRLRSIGIRIAMDDFGTGYSSLGLRWLPRSPADIVKIDRLFIKDIHREAFNRVHRRGHRAVP